MLLNDIKQQSTDAQISCLESFHATLNNWHPKLDLLLLARNSLQVGAPIEMITLFTPASSDTMDIQILSLALSTLLGNIDIFNLFCRPAHCKYKVYCPNNAEQKHVYFVMHFNIFACCTQKSKNFARGHQFQRKVSQSVELSYQVCLINSMFISQKRNICYYFFQCLGAVLILRGTFNSYI